MKLAHSHKNGFSLIEIFVVIGVIAILAAVSFTTLVNRRSRTEFDGTTRRVAALLREAQSHSMAQKDGTTWGVHLENSTATSPFYAIFKTSYSTSGQIGYYRLPTSIQYATSSIAEGGSIDSTFAQISGLPSASSSITLELTGGGSAVTASSTITVNTNGLISF